MKRLLTIAGSDSGGGAGIQADLKTFHQFGCYGMSVLTAVTAQNSLGVHGIETLPPEFVALQLESVVTDFGVDGAKMGMLANVDIVRALAARMRALEIPHLVVDPVMRAKGGDSLLADDAQQALCDEIIPLAEIVTPNLPEAEILAGFEIRSKDDMRRAARVIHENGARNVLVKGGHRAEDATDIFFDGENFTELFAERIESGNTHGTGCTYSAAIAANLALGQDMADAVAVAKRFVTAAIRESLPLGRGIGPLNHFVSINHSR
ncbi:MAG: bifunctional hydroxymethylpyrimidine kinase/phosphomethylpyrimidine kinase [Caldithrix sp.]|nr:MAG: bifunctional hydroxymethylpyrimidine kinase/phosphomethylpyrimidine kinase [Caldithrix sp.]